MGKRVRIVRVESPKAKAVIRREYKVEYPNPIQVKAGESVQVGRADEDYPGWLWCRAADGREGWIPSELLSSQGSPAIVLRDYSAKELAVRPGDEVEVEEVRHGWALVRNAQGDHGWIPKSHMEL
jgi:SH3-like domain-containing protein